jgi:hypothetical protein
MASSTIFKNFTAPVEKKSLILIANDISSGKYKAEVEEIRSLLEKGKTEEATTKKKQLLAFTPSAVFSEKRQMPFLEMYSGYVHLDFDKLTKKQLDAAFKVIAEIPYTFLCFISPSGNGLKVFIEVNSEIEHHDLAYLQVQKFYEEATGLKADPSCKDITRLCFMSYDPNLFINSSNKIFEIKINKMNNPTKLNDIQQSIKDCIYLTNKSVKYSEGSRNNYIYQLASHANRKGIQQSEILQYCLNSYDIGDKEVKTTINSVYKNHKNEYGLAGSLIENNNFIRVENYLKSNYDFRYNTITNEVEYKSKDAEDFETCNENEIYCSLRKANYRISQADLKAIICSSFTSEFNPFIAYFKNLKPWNVNDKSEIDNLITFIKVKDENRFKIQLRKAFVRNIACAILPKVVNKQAFILISPNQNIGKSFFLSLDLSARSKKILHRKFGIR